MTENKTSLKDRFKKALKPAIMVGVAALGYFAGIKQNNKSSDSFDSVREAMGGQIAHAVLEGANGAKAEYFSEGDFHRVIVKDVNGMETRTAFDTKTGDGLSWSSDGTTMRIEDGQWVEADLTEAQHAIVHGAYDSYLESQKGSLTKGQEAIANGTFDAFLMSQGKQND